MITKVLLVDPSIGFAVGIKRALEQPGGYRVVTFANGQAALDLVRTEPQDVAILDFEPDDMDIVSLITALREIQPGLSILVSPRTETQLARVPSLDVQGKIDKPYLVRHLIPVIRDTLAARVRQNNAMLLASSQPMMPIEGAEPIKLAAETVEQPVDMSEPPADVMDTPSMGVPIMHGTEDFDAALAALSPPSSTELFVTPDDTFHRHLAAMQNNAPTTTAGLRKTLENFAMPPTAEDSTLAEVIGATSGTTTAVELALSSNLPEAINWTEQFTQAEATDSNWTDGPADGLRTPATLSESANIEPSFVAALTAVNTPLTDLTANADFANEVDSAAEIAARLTHLAMQSTAYATILTQSGALVASAGELSPRAVAGVVETIVQIWQTADDDDSSTDASNTLPPRIRYIQVPGVGDFALYSIHTIDELYLSVLFPADTSLRLIRQQARRLIESLEQGSVGLTSDVVSSNNESEAAKTQMSRPTEPLIPGGLREAIAEQGLASTYTAYADRDDQASIPTHDNRDGNSINLDVESPGQPSDAQVPQPTPHHNLATIPDVPYSPYTLLWLPRDEAALMDIADHISGWIHTVSMARAWKVAESTISAGCVIVRIDLPADQTPSGAIDALQRAIAERINDADLWAEAYYVIASERTVMPDEIALFVEYRRSARNSG